MDQVLKSKIGSARERVNEKKETRRLSCRRNVGLERFKFGPKSHETCDNSRSSVCLCNIAGRFCFPRVCVSFKDPDSSPKPTNTCEEPEAGHLTL